MVTISSLKMELTELDHYYDSGSFATYYAINGKVGIKVIELDSKNQMIRSRTIKALKETRGWADAKHEYSVLKKLKKSNLAPLPIKLVPAFDDGKGYWLPAIVMQHIEGETFLRTRREQFVIGSGAKIPLKMDDWPSERHLDELGKFVTKALAKYGVVHGDLHFNNVIDNNGKLKIIDFGFAKMKVKK